MNLHSLLLDRMAFLLRKRERARRTLFLQAILLLGGEVLARAVDYGFHLYLGRVLEAEAFATSQAFFSLAMIFITLAGILQVPVARYVAAPPTTASGATVPVGAIVRGYLWQAAGAGVAMGVFLWFLAVPLAQGTNLPLAMVRLVGVMFPLAMLRPVFLGYLQGQGRFSTYGAVSLVYALARLTFIAIGRKVGVLDPFWVAQSLLWATALVVILGLLLARRDLFQRGRLAWPLMWQGWRLSLVVLIVSTAFMALTNLDVVWVHRFWPQMAGAYARVVVLRRIVSFMPLAVGIVLLPRMAALGADRRRTRRLVFFAAGIVLANGVLLTSLYGLYGGTIDRLVFGADVPAPASWFVGMALAATGFGLVTIWINVFLATKPFPFGYILLVAALVQGISYGLLGRTPESIIALWAFSGWLLALVGAGLYGWQNRSPVDSARSLPITL